MCVNAIIQKELSKFTTAFDAPCATSHVKKIWLIRLNRYLFNQP